MSDIRENLKRHQDTLFEKEALALTKRNQVRKLEREFLKAKEELEILEAEVKREQGMIHALQTQLKQELWHINWLEMLEQFDPRSSELGPPLKVVLNKIADYAQQSNLFIPCVGLSELISGKFAYPIEVHKPEMTGESVKIQLTPEGLVYLMYLPSDALYEYLRRYNSYQISPLDNDEVYWRYATFQMNVTVHDPREQPVVVLIKDHRPVRVERFNPDAQAANILVANIRNLLYRGTIHFNGVPINKELTR